MKFAIHLCEWALIAVLFVTLVVMLFASRR